MKKRILAALCTLCLLVSLLPMTALAQDIFYPAITGPALGADNPLTEGTYYLLDADGIPTEEGASADSYNVWYHDGTVTLNNAQLTTGLYIPGGTTVEFLGVNASGTAAAPVSTCIQVMTPGDLTVTGTGSYTGFSSSGDGIINTEDTGNIIITGGSIDLTGLSTGVNARNGSITISGSAHVQARNISAGKDIVIEGSADVTAEKLDADNTCSFRGSAKVTVTAYGIDGYYGIEVLDNAEVSATSNNGNAMNAFEGPITINSTKKLYVASTASKYTPAINVGTGSNSVSYDLTIKSEVEAHGRLALAVSGAGNNIIIDGGKVTAPDVAYIGIFAMSTGKVEIKNGAEVSLSGPGAGTPGIATSTSDTNAIEITDSTVEISNFGFGMSSKAVTLRDSAVTVSSATRAFLVTPQLSYTAGVSVLAGDSADTAQKTPQRDLDADTFTNLYVKISVPESYSITCKANNGEADTTETVAVGASFTLPSPVRSGYAFAGWLADDGVGTLYPAGATVTPEDDLTLTAQWTPAKEWVDADNGNLDVDVNVSVDVSVSAGTAAAIGQSSQDALAAEAEDLLESILNGETPAGITADQAEEARALLNSGAERVEAVLTVNATLKGAPTQEEAALIAPYMTDGETAQVWDLSIDLTLTAKNGDDTVLVAMDTLPLTETDTPIAFHLTTGQDHSAMTVRVLHIHDGAVSTADFTAANSTDGKVTVNANQFSPYIVLTKAKAADNGKTDPVDPGKTDPTTPGDGKTDSGKTDSGKPVTGDAANLSLWITVAAVSGLGACAAIVCGKKKSRAD